MTVKQWYTAAQLAGMPGLPVTPSGIVRRARIDGWVTRRRVFGKGMEYRVVPGPDWPLITRKAPCPQRPAPAVNAATPRQWYTAAQLAGMPGQPTTRQGVLVRAKRKEWPSRRRAHGKGMEYRVVPGPDWPLVTKEASRPQRPAPAVNATTPRQWYSAAQLAGMPGLPRTRQGVIIRANREDWPSRTRKGKGGGREFRVIAVPAETLRAMLAGDDHG